MGLGNRMNYRDIIVFEEFSKCSLSILKCRGGVIKFLQFEKGFQKASAS